MTSLTFQWGYITSHQCTLLALVCSYMVEETKFTPGGDEILIINTLALDGQGEIESIFENDNHLSSIRGYTNELGYFDLVFDRQSNVNYNYLEAYTPSLHLIKEAIQHYASAVTMKSSHPKKGQHFVVLPGSKMAQIRQSSGNAELPLNLIVTQVSGSGAFSMEAAFESASYTNRRGRLSGQKYREDLTEHIDKFHQRFVFVHYFSGKLCNCCYGIES